MDKEWSSPTQVPSRWSKMRVQTPPLIPTSSTLALWVHWVKERRKRRRRARRTTQQITRTTILRRWWSPTLTRSLAPVKPASTNRCMVGVELRARSTNMVMLSFTTLIMAMTCRASHDRSWLAVITSTWAARWTWRDSRPTMTSIGRLKLSWISSMQCQLMKVKRWTKKKMTSWPNLQELILTNYHYLVLASKAVVTMQWRILWLVSCKEMVKQKIKRLVVMVIPDGNLNSNRTQLLASLRTLKAKVKSWKCELVYTALVW